MDLFKVKALLKQETLKASHTLSFKKAAVA
jgi:hypothetical protein